MKVLMLGWELPPHITGGLGTACAGIVRGLGTLGHDVRMLVPQGSAIPGAYSGGAYGPGLFEAVARHAERARELAAAHAHDLVHAHDWTSLPAGVAARAEGGRPLVWHVHSCEYDRAPGGADPRIVALEQQGLDAADLVVCVSHYTAGVLRERFRVDPAKLRVVHNGVEPRARPAESEKRIPEPLVLFLGRVTQQKGPDTFLHTAALVLRTLPRVKFVVSGSGDLLPATIESCASLGLARNVHFTGFLAGPEVERILAMADLYVMPSVSEPFGLAPLEALALDTPVIVSRQSGVVEVLKSALVVDHWDVQGMAREIVGLLRAPARRRALARRGRRELEGLRWERAAARLADVYAELVS
jgi:glycosyltransferase involved in cell wall biosynthesis